MIIAYKREEAVSYAKKWACGRNPLYCISAGHDSDSANFASQCIFAGIGVMNPARDGWYYNSPFDYSPSWSGAGQLCRFLTENASSGPYAARTCLCQIQPGDLIQIAAWKEEFHHTLIAVSVGLRPSLDNILVAAHSYNSDSRPLISYGAKSVRCLHILGGRDGS